MIIWIRFEVSKQVILETQVFLKEMYFNNYTMMLEIDLTSIIEEKNNLLYLLTNKINFHPGDGCRGYCNLYN